MAEGEDGSGGAGPTTLGSYRVLQPLGSGGMSSVFRAAHSETGLVVALKVLPKTLAKRSTLLQRFLREAKSAESLQHPSIVAIYDRGFDGGRHYLVLEYVDGGDLHDLVADNGPMAPALALKAIRQAAEGLRYAAAQGVIHRDIKPANLLRAKDGTVKVTDLGLAIQAESEDERVTRDGTTVGTVDYMAPEQARDSRATGVRSDIYSLGCTFYYLLAGTPPYPGGDIVDKLRRHAKTPAPDARQVRPEVPEVMSQLIRRMMAKRPERRFDDYDQLIATLDALEGGKVTPAALTALIDDEDDPPATLTALIDDEDDPPASSSAATLTALIDDEGVPPGTTVSRALAILADTGGFALADPTTSKAPTSPKRPTWSSDVPDLAALAALDSETPGVRPSRPTPRPDVPAPPQPRPVVAPTLDPIELQEPSSEDVEVFVPPPVGVGWKDVRGWIIGGVLGLAIVGAGTFAFQHFSGDADGPGPGGEDGIVESAEGSGPSTSSGKAGKKAGTDTGQPAATATALAWVEPTEPTRELSAEPDLGDIVPNWATGGRSSTAGRVVAVRRIGGIGPGATVVPTLRKAFDELGAVVEIADDGPFFEPNLKIPGAARTIRARPGYRPILVIEAPNTDPLKEQSASILVEGSSLTLEGLDLIVRVGDLTPRQIALFAVRHGSLTLRDCTITIEAPADRPYAAFRVEEPSKGERASSILLERTLVRGATSATFALSGAEATLRVDRSVLLSGAGSIVQAGIGAGPDAVQTRSLELIRSVAASSGPLLDLAPSRSGADPPFALRLVASTAAMVRAGPRRG